ncbi:cystathionine beta-lyase [Ewingella americana]
MSSKKAISSKKIETTLVSAGRDKKYTLGSVNAVIQRASSLVFNSVEEKKFATKNRANGELFYGRRGTLTHFSFQQAMVELEGGAGCVLYPCGAAAVSNAILSFVSTGDHILVASSAYEPTQDFAEKVLRKLGVSTTYFPADIGENLGSLMQPNTKVVFLEAPGSITMEMPDLPAMVRAVRAVSPEVIIMIDNTWAAGILFKALDFDIDISIQAGTKYIIGHSDAMIGTRRGQRSLLGAASRALLSDGPNGGCRHCLRRQPWPAYLGHPPAPTRREQHSRRPVAQPAP